MTVDWSLFKNRIFLPEHALHITSIRYQLIIFNIWIYLAYYLLCSNIHFCTLNQYIQDQNRDDIIIIISFKPLVAPISDPSNSIIEHNLDILISLTSS